MTPSRGSSAASALWALFFAHCFSASSACSPLYALSPAAYTARLTKQGIDTLLLKDHKSISPNTVRQDFQAKIQKALGIEETSPSLENYVDDTSKAMVRCPSELRCDGGLECRWRSDRSVTSGAFYVGRGRLSPAKLKDLTGFTGDPVEDEFRPLQDPSDPESTFPPRARRDGEEPFYEEPYLIGVANAGSREELRLQSRPIPGNGGRAEVSFEVYLTPGLTMDLCLFTRQRRRGPFAKHRCITRPPVSQGEGPKLRFTFQDELSVPFKLVFIVKGFGVTPGGIAVLRRIRFESQLCLGEAKRALSNRQRPSMAATSFLRSSRREGSQRSRKVLDNVCDSVACAFQGTACSFQSVSLGLNSGQWFLLDGPRGPVKTDTSGRGWANGAGFLLSEGVRGGEDELFVAESDQFSLSKPAELRFWLHLKEPTSRLRLCLSSLDYCPWERRGFGASSGWQPVKWRLRPRLWPTGLRDATTLIFAADGLRRKEIAAVANITVWRSAKQLC